MSGSENSMPEPRPAASLTASLLARRGGARPAMRRQALGNLVSLPINDDLGWNDMGDEDHSVLAAVEQPAPVESITRAEPPLQVEASAPLASVSPVTEQIQALADRMSTKRAATPATKRARPASLTSTPRKAAFTLRIDPERHLRLRLLSAVSNRSAQQLLIEALDGLIAQNDQLKTLADQIEARNAAPDVKWGS